MTAEPMWIGTGVALDLTLTATVLFWATLVRTDRVSSAFIAPFLVASAAISWWLLADRVATLTTLLLGIVAAVELIAIGLLLFNAGRIIKKYRAVRSDGASFDESLSQAVAPVIGNRLITDMLVTEASILYHAVFGWGDEPPKSCAGTEVFSYHEENGWKTVAVSLCAMLLVELVPVHILLSTWQPVAAWIVSALSIYSLLWVIGDYHAIRLTPVRLTDERLEVRIGRRWSVDIDVDQISSIEVVNGSFDEDESSAVDISLIGAPDVILEVRDEHELTGPFGIRKGFKTLALSMDNPSEFIRAVERARD
jgi:hypothetical protein